MLSDKVWLDTVYFPTNLCRLRATVGSLTSSLAALGVPVMAPQAGLFIWADFRKYIKSDTKEAEMDLFQEMFDKAKVVSLTFSLSVN